MNDDMIFKSNLYDLLVEKILNRLMNFIQYNPDDLHRNILKKLIEQSIIEITNLNFDELDKSLASLARIRMYSDPGKGVYIKSNYYNLFIPNVNIDSINQHEAEMFYLKAFFTKLLENLKETHELQQLINRNETDKLKNILNNCHKYAVEAMIYQIIEKKPPNTEELDDYIKSIK